MYHNNTVQASVKMLLKVVIAFFLAITSTLTEITDFEHLPGNDEFTVVSTSPRPSVIQKLDDRLTQIERQLEFAVKTRENDKILETRINVLQLQLRKIEENTRGLPKFAENSEGTGSKSSFPKNCKEVQKRGFNVSGIYHIQPIASSEAFMVVCDMQTRGGGWAYFLNRFDGSQEFYLDWKEYKQGFGNLAGEFWLGLEHLHRLTKTELNELLVELVDWDGKKVHAHYSSFSIGSEEEGYSLKVLGGYSGDAGDSLTTEGGNKFSTQDRDQDRDSGNCATYHKGAWWYNSCMSSHLTGKYLQATVSDSNKYKIMYWDKFRGPMYSLKEARMMVRPRDATSSPFNLNGRPV